MKTGPLRHTWFDATHRSGQVITLEAPTLENEFLTALGRITQDLREDPATRDAFVSLRVHQGYGVSVIAGGARRDFSAASPDEFGCAGAFIDAIAHIRDELLQTDEQRAVVDRILINRLRERKPDRVLTAQQAAARPMY